MSKILLNLNIWLGIALPAIYFVRKKYAGFGANNILELVLLIAAMDLYEEIAVRVFKLPTAVAYKVYLLAEFFVVLRYFFFLNRRKPLNSYLVFALVYLSLFVYVCTGYSWDFKTALWTDSFLSAVEALMVYFFAIVWFVSLFKGIPENSLTTMPDFYFVSGLILYTVSPIFLFLLSSKIMGTAEFPDYWIFNLSLNIILKFFLIIGLWKLKK